MTKNRLLPSDTSAFSLIQTAAVLYIIVWSIAPPLQIDLIFRLAALGAAAIWFVIEFVSHIDFSGMQVWSLLYMIAVILTAYLDKGDFDGIIQQIPVYIMVLCFFINVYCEDRWNEMRIIIPIILLLFVLFNIKTIQTLSTDATIARRIVRNDAEMNQYMKQGVGGYALVYSEVCIFPAVFAWTLKALQNDKLMFIIGAVWNVTYVLLISNAGYSIAIFTSLAGLAILLLYRRDSFVIALLLAVSIFGIGLYSIVYWTGFRNLLNTIFAGTKVVKKIEDLVLSATVGSAEGSIGDRISRYKVSLEAILQYPIIGGWLSTGGGGHSAIMDMFAKYGIFGGVPYVAMLFQAPNSQRGKYDNGFFSAVLNASMIAITFVAFLDSVPYQLMAPILVFMPLFLDDILVWSGEKNYENSLDG